LLFLIEHMDEWSPWIDIEYAESYRVCRREGIDVVVTNASPEVMIKGRYPRIPTSVEDVPLDPERVAVLVPEAEDPLTPEDSERLDAVVVGGILGDHPRRKRTLRLLVPKLKGFETRTLGPYHFSIDGAVKVALRVLVEGIDLEEVEVVEKPELEVEPGHTVTLNCDYPAVDGDPWIPEELVDYLREGIVEYEEAEFSARRAGRDRRDGPEGTA